MVDSSMLPAAAVSAAAPVLLVALNPVFFLRPARDLQSQKREEPALASCFLFLAEA